MKKLFLIFLLFLLPAISFAANEYGCTSLTGGGAGALDAIDITGASSPNADNLADGDVAEVQTISGTTTTSYYYVYDADGTAAESSPTVIRPDDYASAGNWILTKLEINGVQLRADGDFGDFDITSADKIEFYDSAVYIDGGADGILEIEADTGIDIGTAGVRVLDDADGAITLTGLGDGSDEDLTFNFDDVANTVDVSSSTGVTFIDFNGMAVGTVHSPISISTNTTLTDDQVHGRYIMVTAACTVTLPAVSSAGTGSMILVYVRDAAETVIIDANAADRIVLDATALDDGDSIDSAGAAGDFIVLWATDADGWRSLGRSGTWTDGGAS